MRMFADLKNDFDRELDRATIPFKELLRDKHYDALFRQFVKAESKPSFDLYISEHYKENELKKQMDEVHKRIPSIENTRQLIAANFVAATPFETHINDLHSEFYKLVAKNKLSQKYYCNDITKTGIAKVFYKVDTIMGILKKSVIPDNYDIYKEVDIRTRSILMAVRDIDKSIAKDLLQLLIEDNNNVAIYAHIWCSDTPTISKGHLFDRWQALKDYFNLKLEELLLEESNYAVEKPLQQQSAKSKVLNIAFLGLKGDNLDKYYSREFARWRFDNSDEVWMDGELLNATQKSIIKAALYNIKPKPNKIVISDLIKGSELTEKRFVEYELKKVKTAKDVSLATRYNIEDYKQFLDKKAKEIGLADAAGGNDKTQPGSQTLALIQQHIENIHDDGWKYSFHNEKDYNTFIEILTAYFEQTDYSLPKEAIKLKRNCKTKLSKALGEILRELSDGVLKKHTGYFEIIKKLSPFEEERDIYRAITR